MDKKSKHWKPAPVVVPRPVEPEPASVPAAPPKDGKLKRLIRWLTN